MPQNVILSTKIKELTHEQRILRAYDHCALLYNSLPLTELELQASFNDAPFGAMDSPSYFYIERATDERAIKSLQNRTIFIQAPRQMGKSSLINRLIHHTRASHVAAWIDLEQLPEATLSHSDDFFMEFCGLISDTLKLPDKVDEFWASKRRSNTVKCTRYLTDYILPALAKPLILALDEVERLLLTSPFRNDFFGMLRSWHEDRNISRLTLLLSGSTEPSLFITNQHQSPFNVAERITLQDFTLAQLQTLNQRYDDLLPANQVEALYNLLGGQPFLTRLVWYQAALGQIKVADLLANPLADDSPFYDHLSRYWQLLLDFPELHPALGQICRQQTYREDKIYFRLMGSGLIKKQNKQVTMRNELYRLYFEERL